MLALAYDIQLHAIGKGEGFDPQTGAVIRHDRGLKRWVRGFFRGRWWLNILHVLYSIGAWATAGLGLYAAIKGIHIPRAFIYPDFMHFPFQKVPNSCIEKIG